MSAATTKDFGPIRDDYTFFETHATEAENDLRAYLPHVQALALRTGPLHMLDFGCGPGTFTARFLGAAGFPPGRLHLALVEPVEAYRRQATQRVRAFTDHPVQDWPRLPADTRGEFDLVLSNHVLYYVPDLDAELGGILRALASPGLFLTALADQRNVLIHFWNRGFELLGIPVPHHTAEDVEAALTRLGRPFSKEDVPYRLEFADTEENREKIARFLMADYYPKVPRGPMLALFDPYVRDGRVVIDTLSVQFAVRK